VNWGAVNATLPKGITEAAVMLDQAMDLIRAKIASGPPPKAGRKPVKVKTAAKAKAPAKGAAGEADKKAPSKNAPARKASASQATSKKPAAN
jgi:DNA topoisomerase-1